MADVADGTLKSTVHTSCSHPCKYGANIQIPADTKTLGDSSHPS